MPKTRANVQTAPGECAQHGRVQGERERPRPSFPFVVYLIRRSLANRAPFTCPECGAAITRS